MAPVTVVTVTGYLEHRTHRTHQRVTPQSAAHAIGPESIDPSASSRADYRYGLRTNAARRAAVIPTSSAWKRVATIEVVVPTA